MALLKFRQISLADWQTLEVKDPDTRYIVYNEDESIYGEFIGEEKVTAEVDAHIEDLNNPHSVTKEQVGLSNVDNTSDLDKPVSTAQQTSLNNKVDKIEGKGLSTNDFTNNDKNKLDGIAAGAEVNVQSDWTQEVNTADDYIKNKPTIPTVPTISTSIATDETSDAKTASPKAVKTYVDNAISTAIGDLLGGEY